MSIVDEFHALQPVPRDDRTAAGIPARAETISRCGGLRQARARFAFEPALGRYFEFSAEGLPCWCVAAYEHGLLIDIIAWPLGKPRRYASLERKAWALGADDALSPNRLGPDSDRLPPIHVYRDPMIWLRAGTEGLVILDAARAKKGRPVAASLAQELLDAYKGEGTAITTRQNMHRMAEANKAFAHFAW